MLSFIYQYNFIALEFFILIIPILIMAFQAPLSKNHMLKNVKFMGKFACRDRRIFSQMKIPCL